MICMIDYDCTIGKCAHHSKRCGPHGPTPNRPRGDEAKTKKILTYNYHPLEVTNTMEKGLCMAKSWDMWGHVRLTQCWTSVTHTSGPAIPYSSPHRWPARQGEWFFVFAPKKRLFIQFIHWANLAAPVPCCCSERTTEKHTFINQEGRMKKTIIDIIANAITLPKNNIARARRPSQKEPGIPTIHFQVLTVSFRR